MGATPPPQTVGHVNQPLWCHMVTATQQTRDIDTMLAYWWPTVYNTGPALAY